MASCLSSALLRCVLLQAAEKQAGEEAIRRPTPYHRGIPRYNFIRVHIGRVDSASDTAARGPLTCRAALLDADGSGASGRSGN